MSKKIWREDVSKEDLKNILLIVRVSACCLYC